MRHGRPTDEELKKIFVTVLGEVLGGRGVRTCAGLDDDTETALWAIGKAHPHVSLELVDAARQAFAGQLDGSNAARWQRDMDRWFERREERRHTRIAGEAEPPAGPSADGTGGR